MFAQQQVPQQTQAGHCLGSCRCLPRRLSVGAPFPRTPDAFNGSSCVPARRFAWGWGLWVGLELQRIGLGVVLAAHRTLVSAEPGLWFECVGHTGTAPACVFMQSASCRVCWNASRGLPSGSCRMAFACTGRVHHTQKQTAGTLSKQVAAAASSCVSYPKPSFAVECMVQACLPA